MPLPDKSAAKQPWPPSTWEPIQKDIAEAATWYGGDPQAIANFYGHGDRVAKDTKFNTTPAAKAKGIHVPASADIAAMAADMLFGATPTFEIPEAHGDEPTEAADKATRATAEATEAYLDDLVDRIGLSSTLLEAAEISSGLSGVFLRPFWDTKVSPLPLLSVVHPDHAVPTFVAGVLVEVTFWSVLKDDKGKIWRHLECYDGPSKEGGSGTVTHGLYVGSVGELGEQVPLDSHPTTADITDVDEDGVYTLPAGIGLAARYVPNVGPNRKHRGKSIGRSDCAGTEGLMAALDEAMTSWMRDIRLGKKRIIVPAEFLERRDPNNQGRGGGLGFNDDREVFSPMEMDPAHIEKAGITPIEMDLRVEEHEKTCMALFTQIVQTAGYSPQSFGLAGDGAQQTATEVDAREGRSERTTARKQGYWDNPLTDMLEILLILAKEEFDADIEPMRPRIVWPDARERNLRDLSSTLNLLSLAKAASTETKVRMLNPEWTEGQVQSETTRILAEEGTQVGDPTGGFP